MTPTTHALIICVIFLCGLEETISEHRLCVGNQCFGLFQEPADFPGAQKSCKDSGGQLSSLTSGQELKTLLGGLGGSFWLDLLGNKTTAEEAVSLQNCFSVSALVGVHFTYLREPCGKKLDGFLCQYTMEKSCSRLQAGKDAQVKYTTRLGFEMNDSAMFPLETIAEKVGVKYPESKHICLSKNWKPAPWNCEVNNGGCEHRCSPTTQSCICPAGKTLHPNNFTCVPDKCAKGYKLSQDGKKCVDVDECKELEPCKGEGEECFNEEGGFECRCIEGFDMEEGVCVDIRICEKCEHMNCEKISGVYQCKCRQGFRVSPEDPTRCDQYCGHQDCPAMCVMDDCSCPYGYILDVQNDTKTCVDINECEIEQQCDHKCENLFGSFRCSCHDGYELQKGYKCVKDGSGPTPAYSTPASTHRAVEPFYAKTGSVLVVTVFVALCAALLGLCLVRNVVKRYGKLELPTLKGPDMDIFSLQQVTTETYKRLSFDKQFKNDPQRL